MSDERKLIALAPERDARQRTEDVYNAMMDLIELWRQRSLNEAPDIQDIKRKITAIAKNEDDQTSMLKSMLPMLKAAIDGARQVAEGARESADAATDAALGAAESAHDAMERAEAAEAAAIATREDTKTGMKTHSDALIAAGDVSKLTGVAQAIGAFFKGIKDVDLTKLKYVLLTLLVGVLGFVVCHAIFVGAPK